MTCRNVIESLSEYRSGDLHPAERTCFEAHLARCPHCVEYVRSYEETIRLTKGAVGYRAAGTSVDVPEELVQAILLRAHGSPASCVKL